MTTNSWHEFRQKASAKPQRIIFAEGEDPRVVKAAWILQRDKIAFPELMGSQRKIENLWKKEGGREADLHCVDPETFSDAEKQSWAEAWLSIPKNKTQSMNEAHQKIGDPLVL